MPADIKAILEMSVRDFAIDMTSQLAMKDLKAVAEARKNPDVTIHNWSAEERAKFRTIAVGQWTDIASRSKNAQKAYDVLTNYLRDQGMLTK